MKKVLPVAVLAALAGVNGAQAVHVNPDGLGQVLLYPFYTTNDGQDTLIQLVNTTDDYKAVKIRILESMNSQEVLDFNLYLSPYDHWSALITATEDGGASISTGDTSCTVPTGVSDGLTIPFRTTLFDGSGDATADSVATVDRTAEGYVEVIEMGVIIDSDDGVAAAIKHIGGIPGGDPDSCDFLDTRWGASGVWGGGQPNDSISAPAGGLYGYGILIDVARATDATYDAVAIDNWTEGSPFHTGPGFLTPNLGNGSTDYDVFDEGGVVSGSTAGDLAGWDAISALFMHNSISNDYVLEPSIGAGTDWVVTFPTKRVYVNGISAPLEPFSDEWDPETSTACEVFSIRYFDREEGEPIDPPSLNDFSPLPPVGEIPEFSFCWEANVLSFNGSDVLGSVAAGRSGANFNFEDDFNNGWARLDFNNVENQLETLDHTFFGLPTIGFAVQRYINGNTASGDTNNYAGTVTHKTDRSVSLAP